MKGNILTLLCFCIILEANSLSYRSQKGCISDPADVVFLLDSSTSVGSTNFQAQLKYVAEFATHYVIGSHNVQLGITTFATNVANRFNMNTHLDINSLENAIKTIVYSNGATHTGTALRFVQANSFTLRTHDRSNVPNFLVVITDGKSNGPVSVVREAAKLHSSTNIETFAIGVGNGINKTELQAIASSPKHVLLISDHLNLHLPLQQIRCPLYQNNTPVTMRTQTTSQVTPTTTLKQVTRNPCNPNPCKNRGVCKPFAQIFYCQCAVGYTGKTCATTKQVTKTTTTTKQVTSATTKQAVNPCYPNPCNNGGTCVPFATIYYCRCALGYKGTTCTTIVNNTCKTS